MTLSRWLRIARSNRPPHLTGRKEGSSDGAYNSLVGNAASGTSTTRVTLQPTVGTCERRASGFAAAGGNDADDGGATHSGAHDEEHAADRDSFEPKFRGLTGFEIPARGRPETDAARPDPTPGTRPTPGLRDGHISAEVHVHDRRYGIPVQQPTLSTHRPGPGGTCAEGSGLEDFSASPSICCASVCIN